MIGGASDTVPPVQAPRSEDDNGEGGSEPGLPFSEHDLDSPIKNQTGPPLTWRSCLFNEPLLAFTLLGVLLGIVLGALLRQADPSPTTIEFVGFPGEIMLRLLKMLVLPLVACSISSAMCNLQRQEGPQGVNISKLARLTAAFYILSTIFAIILGLILVVIIQPGSFANFDELTSTTAGCGGERGSGNQDIKTAVVSTTKSTALFDVARMIVPDNIIQAAVNMNVLGIITFSLLFGWALSGVGPAATPVINGLLAINVAVGKMVTAALWISPVGVGSLIAASILRACDVTGIMKGLALWMVTVIIGLSLFSFAILPALLFMCTRRSPLKIASYFGHALAVAFGTSSSAASLPLAMEAAKNAGCSENIVSFFLPLGIAVNMNGTALYEAVTVVFIAQAHGVALGLADMLVVAATASLAAIGAPAIPSAGLVTMLIVLQAVGLERYSGDLAVILAMDWLLDRLRTAVNVVGDVFGCVIVDHMMAKGEMGGNVNVEYQQIEMQGGRV